MKSTRPLPLRERVVIGALFVGMGVFIMWLSVADSGSVNGPWWLGFAAGMVFASAGLSVATQGTSSGVWVGPLAVGLIFLGFAAIGNWIAFGPGPRACSGGFSSLTLSGSGSLGDMECRVAFGFGAVIINAFIFMVLMGGVAKLVGNPVWAGRLKKAGENVLFVAVSPLVLMALVLAVGGAGVKAVGEKLRGKSGR